MNKHTLVSAIALSFFAVNGALGSTYIKMTNETKFPAQISVTYGSCNPDKNIEVQPGQTVSIYAGICLIRQIDASVYLPGNAIPVTATPYTSSGTGYRTFKLMQNYDGSFAVIRP